MYEQFEPDFTSKIWLVVAIKAHGIKTVNRNPLGHFLQVILHLNRELGKSLGSYRKVISNFQSATV